ncbi:bifunctional DNA-binding transcriptional regulator/antitoxin component of YhaV-PrlF toxin-antitoxin module [Neorhizobium huautlense]|uniref:Bifunctional DNA-binding transcriptional regulator/antitoxin component of YhaV-PrlF toxin-antitoxin module n=1 Tax=Neorhizobium huautlense TaxID=67774 RepID=A0ABT9PZU1_9HYPH|nr:AbrB/MazE/SpoVT family DNA-binding domain-containing protein [Neorhizobium huautlense]MDP9839995.1 bifunctional DNA-binding transcriptional regulator/antitoxin component of YhaV-PrlF toxin-antitoxin module [Neorhizobium huautlense]
MTILTVTSRGDVTLGKELLETLDIAPGDRLVVLPRADGGFSLSPLPETGTTSAQGKKKAGGLEAFYGSLKNRHNVHVTLDEIKKSIEEGWASEMRLRDDP